MKFKPIREHPVWGEKRPITVDDGETNSPMYSILLCQDDVKSNTRKSSTIVKYLACMMFSNARQLSLRKRHDIVDTTKDEYAKECFNGELE